MSRDGSIHGMGEFNAKQRPHEALFARALAKAGLHRTAHPPPGAVEAVLEACVWASFFDPFFADSVSAEAKRATRLDRSRCREVLARITHDLFTTNTTHFGDSLDRPSLRAAALAAALFVLVDEVDSLRIGAAAAAKPRRTSPYREYLRSVLTFDEAYGRRLLSFLQEVWQGKLRLPRNERAVLRRAKELLKYECSGVSVARDMPAFEESDPRILVKRPVAAQYLGVDVKSIYDWSRKHADFPPATRQGKAYMYNALHLRAWAHRHHRRNLHEDALPPDVLRRLHELLHEAESDDRERRHRDRGKRDAYQQRARD